MIFTIFIVDLNRDLNQIHPANYCIGPHWTLVAYPARESLGLGAQVCASFRAHLRKFVGP